MIAAVVAIIFIGLYLAGVYSYESDQEELKEELEEKMTQVSNDAFINNIFKI